MTSIGAATPSSGHAGVAERESLSSRRVLFGHQSVGADVMGGIPSESGLAVRALDALGGAPGIHHGPIGRNGDPLSKVEDFSARVRSASSGPLTALMKFCYVDVTPSTDVAKLFEAYRSAMAELRAERAELTVVHVTMPLVTDAGTLAHYRGVFRGRPSRRSVNGLRARYNDLLRAEYSGREPIFDLAALESTSATGAPVTVRLKGKRVPVLAREWTRDGGHLNEAGRRRIGAAFLEMLARL